MNNEGFTLIELLIVVAILGVVGTIATVNLTSSLRETKIKDCNNFVSQIEEDACVYVGLENKSVACNRDTGCTITLDTLRKNGFADYEKDLCTLNDINENYTVTVSWDNETGEKKCYYNGVREYER